MSFMGLVNYFEDHLPHLADELQILREMETDRRYQLQRGKEFVD